MSLGNAVFYGEIDARPLRALRVGFGIALLFYLWQWRDLNEILYGAMRMGEAEGVGRRFPSMSLSVISPFHEQSDVGAWWAAGLVFAAAMVLGIAPLVSSLGAFLVVNTFVNVAALAPGWNETGDYLLRATSFPMLIAACTGQLAPERPNVPRWGLLFFRALLVIFVWFLALETLSASAWRDGTLLCHRLADHETLRVTWALGCDGALAWASRLASWGAVAFGLALPLIIWTRRWRRPVVLTGAVIALAIGWLGRSPMDALMPCVLFSGFWRWRERA